ncbi:MAG: hypothetical protein IPG00_20680 [Saprospiraceae bacterium]|nr:hypothetical protein [Saprospiraceae bacterium]
MQLQRHSQTLFILIGTSNGGSTGGLTTKGDGVFHVIHQVGTILAKKY